MFGGTGIAVQIRLFVYLAIMASITFQRCHELTAWRISLHLVLLHSLVSADDGADIEDHGLKVRPWDVLEWMESAVQI